MSLPLIPMIVGGKLFYDLWKADEYEQEALAANYEAFSTVEVAARKSQEQYAKMEQQLLKLANRKKGIMYGSLAKFKNIYEKIIKINFKECMLVDGHKELMLTQEAVQEINQMISVSGISMSDKEILCTFIFSPKYFGFGGLVKKDAKINLDLAYARTDEADVIESQYKTIQITLEGISNKIDSFLKILTQLNVLFLKSIQYSSEIINKNGYNRENYTDEDKKGLMTCINMAKAIKDILETELFDNDGKISRQIDETLNLGNDYIEKMKQIAS